MSTKKSAPIIIEATKINKDETAYKIVVDYKAAKQGDRPVLIADPKNIIVKRKEVKVEPGVGYSVSINQRELEALKNATGYRMVNMRDNSGYVVDHKGTLEIKKIEGKEADGSQDDKSSAKK